MTLSVDTEHTNLEQCWIIIILKSISRNAFVQDLKNNIFDDTIILEFASFLSNKGNKSTYKAQSKEYQVWNN